jgi:virginiamycin B lyase
MARAATIAALVLLAAACAGPQHTVRVPKSDGQPHIYWGDDTLEWTANRQDPIDHTATIGSANLDGSGMNPSAIIGLDDPCGVAVDGHYVYWANRNGNTIGRARLDGSAVDNRFITLASAPCGVAVDDGHIYWANHGAIARGTTIGRANLDGSGADQTFIGGALNPCGVAVDSGHIYWANEADPKASGGTIGRANLDGNEVDN